MNPPKVTDEDYINFIIATPRDVTATEAADELNEVPEDWRTPENVLFNLTQVAS
jgi:hypothetical protein